jgi:two-component system OmpR family sensor kinase
VADAAHELRSPLAALKLQLTGLERADQPEARALAVARLGAGIERATRLVEQLLVLARQEEGAFADASPVDLSALARQALGEMAVAAQAKQIDLGLQHADQVSVSGQADALLILIRNLLDNAIKYTPEGGRVDLELHAGALGPVLEVHDSGPGIAEEERERVFDRFYRIAGSQAGGSGLGMAIIKAIADRHGATLSLGQSERLKGLLTSVRFPALQ